MHSHSAMCMTEQTKNHVSQILYFTAHALFLNILSNAIQHTNKKILISSSLSSSEKIIIIEDDGPGIPENKRLEVFKAFHRLDKSRFSKYGRTGLGLTIAKNIVKGHGGNIKLYKSKIGGLKVRISLPI